MIALFRAMRRLNQERRRLAVAVADHGESARRIESASESLRKRRATDEERERQALEYIRRARHAGAAE